MRSSTPLAPDTIAALSTPIGESAVAVVRVSGPRALDVAAPLLRTAGPLADLSPRRLTRVTLVDPRTGDQIDDALGAVLRAPRSYTGEDTVEIFCHGSPALARMLVDRLGAQGARLADPGEFTRRAFLNGRLDLAQAEAVAQLISARTERAVTLAARAISGDLSRRVAALRAGILDVVAKLEVALDFPDDAPVAEESINVHEINTLRDDAASLLGAARRGLIAHTGLTIAIVGAPNAGKSSLFNALLGRDRAIVTPEAGTTRDVLEGTIVLCGVPVRLLDTAGIGVPRDAVDAEGMRRARQALGESDLAVLVVDGSRPAEARAPAPEDWAGAAAGDRLVVARSKSDLPHHRDAWSPATAIPISVVAPDGLELLLDRLRTAVAAHSGSDVDSGSVSASIRQVELMESMAASLDRAGHVVRTQPMEIALVELRGALDAGSALLGVDVGDAVLDRIFSRFCVGK